MKKALELLLLKDQNFGNKVIWTIDDSNATKKVLNLKVNQSDMQNLLLNMYENIGKENRY